jgi:hypothetical protein
LMSTVDREDFFIYMNHIKMLLLFINGQNRYHNSMI